MRLPLVPERQLVVELVLLLLNIHCWRRVRLGCPLSVAADEAALFGLDVAEVGRQRFARCSLFFHLQLILLDAAPAASLRGSSRLGPLGSSARLLRELSIPCRWLRSCGLHSSLCSRACTLARLPRFGVAFEIFSGQDDPLFFDVILLAALRIWLLMIKEILIQLCVYLSWPLDRRELLI